MAAITLSELIEMRDGLIRARLSGVLMVTHHGKTTTFKSDADMARALGSVNAQIDSLQGNSASGTVLAAFSNDLS